MQIKTLSQKELTPFGKILPQCPEEDGARKKIRLTFPASSEILRYQVLQPTILDYVSGMSVLVIYTDNRTDAFYLDRVVLLQSDTQFSILPMEEECCVDILVDGDAPTPIDTVALSDLEDSPAQLQFEKIYTILYQESSHNFYFRGEKHQAYELVYVDRGELHNLVRGQDILLQQQDFMVIDSNDWHTQYSDLPVNFLTISFWAGDPNLSAITNKRFSITSQLKTVFKLLLTQNEQQPYNNEYRESLLKILLIELLRRKDLEFPATHSTSDHTENEIVDRVIQLVSENLHRKPNLEELASMVHVSVPYLYKLFQIHLGTSPGKYVAKIRIEECKVLLRQGHLTMGQIADTMGFSSLQQFSRQFRNICGITPTEYVRSLR